MSTRRKTQKAASSDPTAGMKENPKCIVRIRPFLPQEEAVAEKEKVKLQTGLGVDSETTLFTTVAVATHPKTITETEKVEMDGIVWSVPSTQLAKPGHLQGAIGSQGDVGKHFCSDAAQAVCNGQSLAVMTYGQLKSGRSHTMWGAPEALLPVAKMYKEHRSESDTVDICDSSLGKRLSQEETDLGVGLQTCKHILNKCRTLSGVPGTSKTFEIQLSFFQIMNEKVRDLLDWQAPLGAESFFASVLKQNPLLGMKPDNVTNVTVSSYLDLESYVTQGLARVIEAKEDHSATHTFLMLDVGQTDVGNAADGSAMTVVRKSRLCCVDTAAAFGVGGGGSNTSMMTLRRVVEQVHVQQIPTVSSSTGRQRSKTFAQAAVPVRESMLTAILSEAFGGSWKLVLIGTVSPLSAHMDETNETIKFLSKARQLTNNIKQSGGVASNVIMGMNEEIARLRKMLLASGDSNSSSNAREKLEDEIHMKESAVLDLQVTANKAIEKYEEMKEKLDEKEKENKSLKAQREDAEMEALAANTNLSVEKQKSFAAAFRGAFQQGKEKRERREQEDEHAKQIRNLKSKLENSNIQQTAIKGERDRLQYENLKLDKDCKKLRVELHAAQSHNQKLTKDLQASQDEAEVLTTKLNLSRFETTNEIHEWRRQLLELERKCDEQGFELEAKTREITLLKEEMNEKIASSMAGLRSELNDTRNEVRKVRGEKANVERQLSDANAACEAQRNKNDLLQQQLDDTSSSFYKKCDVLEKHRLEEVDKQKKIKDQHRIEREGYITLLSEGKESLRELQRAEALFISKPTLYRSGWQGVQAWLKQNGLDNLQSAFEHAGFTDMYSVSNIKEEDLLEMKVLRGTRRRILKASEDVGSQFARVDHVDSQEDQSIHEMLMNLTDWMSDFEACVVAEAEVTETKSTTS